MTKNRATNTCPDCNSPLPARTVRIRTRNCWKCHKRIRFATLHKECHFLVLDLLTKEESEFAKENGVTLERRYSATVHRCYTANVCPNCDQIQGHHYLQQEDQFTESTSWVRVGGTTLVKEIDQRNIQGPCDNCSTSNCETHGPYFNYTGDAPCPDCQQAAEAESLPARPQAPSATIQPESMNPFFPSPNRF